MPKKLDDFAEDMDKLKDKVKLVGLEVDKKSADLEIKIGKVEERFKEVAYDFPKLRDNAEEVESLLHVINLGLVDFKERFSDIDSRMSNLEKMPESVERRIVGIDNKLEKLDEDIKKLYLRLDEIRTIKQDVTKTLEERIASNSEDIRKEISDNRAEVEHLKKNIDALSFAIKSFERTVELTNLDDIIRRFDAVDRKIVNTETDLDQLRGFVRESSIREGDVDALKRKIKEMSSAVMDTLNKVNQLEANINNKLTRVEALEKNIIKLSASKSMTSAATEHLKEMNKIKESMEDLYGKIKRIYDSGDISLDRIKNVIQELSELDKLKDDLKDVRKAVIENRSKIKNLKR